MEINKRGTLLIGWKTKFSMDAGKALQNFSFMIKNSQQIGYNRNVTQHNKGYIWSTYIVLNVLEHEGIMVDEINQRQREIYMKSYKVKLIVTAIHHGREATQNEEAIWHWTTI